MELTLDQALQKGIEAHKAGKVEEADQYYTAILKANPKHPDANHNMGVLAVGVGKVEQALPFFKTALEVNQTIAQFWLSYIDALIKLDRIEDAKGVFAQSQSKGSQGEGFDQLEQRLGLSKSSSDKVVGKSDIQDPPQNQIQAIIDLYSRGQFQEVLSQASHLLLEYPRSVVLHNIAGASYKGLGELEKAVEAYTKAISLKPDYAQAYNNLGNALTDQGNLKEAIEAYNKALSINPDYAEAYNNIGNVLQTLGALEKAIEAYNKALSIRPDYTKASRNMADALQGVVFKSQIEVFKKLLFLSSIEKHTLDQGIFPMPQSSLLKLEPSLQKHLQLVNGDERIDSPLEVISDLCELPLLLKIMSICPLPDLELEKLFKYLRHYILSKHHNPKRIIPKGNRVPVSFSSTMLHQRIYLWSF